jgi:hypothetical protein
MDSGRSGSGDESNQSGGLAGGSGAARPRRAMRPPSMSTALTVPSLPLVAGKSWPASAKHPAPGSLPHRTALGPRFHVELFFRFLSASAAHWQFPERAFPSSACNTPAAVTGPESGPLRQAAAIPALATRKVRTMFRNDVTDFRLSRNASGPRPSYRPAVETLEERTMLNGDMNMNPGSSAADAIALGIVSAQQQLSSRVRTGILLAGIYGVPHNEISAVQGAIGKLLLRERGLQRLMRSLERVADRSDPVFAQASADFHQLDRELVAALAHLSNHVGR